MIASLSILSSVLAPVSNFLRIHLFNSFRDVKIRNPAAIMVSRTMFSPNMHSFAAIFSLQSDGSICYREVFRITWTILVPSFQKLDQLE